MAATKHIGYTFQRPWIGSILNLIVSTVSELVCEYFVTKILTLAQKTTEMRGRESSVALHYPCVPPILWYPRIKPDWHFHSSTFFGYNKVYDPWNLLNEFPCVIFYQFTTVRFDFGIMSCHYNPQFMALLKFYKSKCHALVFNGYPNLHADNNTVAAFQVLKPM